MSRCAPPASDVLWLGVPLTRSKEGAGNDASGCISGACTQQHFMFCCCWRVRRYIRPRVYAGAARDRFLWYWSGCGGRDQTSTVTSTIEEGKLRIRFFCSNCNTGFSDRFVHVSSHSVSSQCLTAYLTFPSHRHAPPLGVPRLLSVDCNPLRPRRVRKNLIYSRGGGGNLAQKLFQV